MSPFARPRHAWSSGQFGKLFGDNGYLSQVLIQQLFRDQRMQIIVKLRKNVRNMLMDLAEKLHVRKRALIETIYAQLARSSIRATAAP